MADQSGITGGEELIAGLEAKYDAIVGRLVEKVNYANNLLAEKIRSNLSGAVLQTQSGKLLGTVREVPAAISGGIVEGGVNVGGPDAPYGIYHEKGRDAPYTITPVNKAYLRFMVDGKEIFTKLVNRPGKGKSGASIPKRAFVEPAKLELEAEIQQALRSAVEG